MIAGLDHITIASAKLGETRRFFVDVIGLKDGDRPDVPVPGYWLYFNERPVVHLVGIEEPRAAKSALDHFAFAIANVDAAKARLDACGVRYKENGLDNGSVRQLVVKDPNGVTIELNWSSGRR